jgi:hypothetical protein
MTRRLALVLLTLAIGCGGDDSSPTPDAPVGGGPDADLTQPDAGNATGEKITLTIEPFDVQAGTERQVCKYVNLPADVPYDVVEMHSVMVGTSHHFNVYKMLTNPTAPVSPADAVVHDCSPASEQLSGDAAYIFGAATPERTLSTPAGVAFHLQPQQVLILEQHVINAGESIVQGGVTFDIYAPAPGNTIEHHADIMWMGFWFINLPNGQETSNTTHCTIPYNAQVFGLMSHTHSLGTHFSIEKWTPPPGGTTHLYDSTDWAHPPYLEFGPPLPLAAGEGLQWTCTWFNDTGHTVTAGQNSTDEMCITFAAAYPTDTLDADPIQCNNFF